MFKKIHKKMYKEQVDKVHTIQQIEIGIHKIKLKIMKTMNKEEKKDLKK